VINQAVGDAVSDMLMTLATLKVIYEQNIFVDLNYYCYKDLLYSNVDKFSIVLSYTTKSLQILLFRF
jgi:hypothetical protein